MICKNDIRIQRHGIFCTYKIINWHKYYYEYKYKEI